MDSDLKCPSCLKDFNVKNIPLELPCHHSYCSKCIKKSIREKEDGNIICPLDSQIFNIEFEDIPISRIYTKFIKGNKTKSNQKLLCMKHEDKKIRYICLNDQEFLCSICILDHYDHKNGITNYNFSNFHDELDLMENLLNGQKKKLDKAIKKIEKLKNNKKSYSEEAEKFFFKSIDLLPSKTKKKLNFPLIYLGKSAIGLNDLKKEINNELIPESKIITTEIFEILNDFFENTLKSYKLLFRASEHNYKAAAFHKECDNKGENLVIIRSKKGYVFGGYCFESWKDPKLNSLRASIIISDQKMTSKVSESFLFSIDNRKKYELLNPVDNIIINKSNYGPHFGKEGEGLHICDNCNIAEQSYGLIFSDIYKNIVNVNSKKEVVSVFFDESKYFLVDEYEVFSLL